MIVAIDGPAGSGKSTTAHAIADRCNLTFLDTGRDVSRRHVALP
jgi:cytidylate kinase